MKGMYWVSTAVMCLIFLMSAGMYIFKNPMAVGFFQQLGFPTWLIYPLAAAKILGVIAVLTGASRMLKEWAYAGFFFDAALAFTAHLMIGDKGGSLAIVALVATLFSRFFYGQLNKKALKV